MELARRFKPSTKTIVIAAAVVIGAFMFGRIPVPSHESSPAPPLAADSVAAVAESQAAPRPAPVLKSLSVVPPAGSAERSAGKPAGPHLARSGAVDLIAPDVERALSEIARVARLNGAGITGLNDERPANAGDVHRASVTVGVPAAAFDRTLSALSGVARMRSRRVDAEDVSDKLVDDGARLRNLRRTEMDLLKIMDRSGRVSEVLDVERELSSTREQIEQLAAELANTERRVALSQIQVTLLEEAPVRAVEPAIRAQVAGAWHAAIDQLGAFTLAAVARAFVVIAFTPYILMGVLLALGLRAILRRRTRVPVSP